VYVANGGDSSVTTLSEAACSAMAAKCSTVIRTVPLGAGQSPAALVADPADQTVFIADAGTGDVSFLDASRCSVGFTAGCSATPRTMAGLSAAGIGFTTEGDVTVADSARDRIVSFSATTCDATTTVGCTALEVDPLTGSPGVVTTSGVTVYAADAGHDSVDIVATPSIVVRITSAHRESSYGWYRSAVAVGYVCTAGSAALASKCPGSVRLTKNTSGRSFGAALIANDGGRVATSAFVRIDMTKPTVRVTGVVNGKRYAKGHHPSLHCVASDSGSGPAACKITISQHGFHGRHRTYTGTAVDKAGNVKRVHGRFTLS
jgi:DNA-binding beta-propeller fold protein YncE